MLGARGEHEEALHTSLFCTTLNALHQLLAVTAFAMFSTDRQTGQLGVIVRMGIEGRAADDNAIMLDNGEMIDLALEKFGVMARLVLEHWGVRATADVGDIVFTMVDLGLLMSQPTDSRLDFVDVYEFDQAFEQAYPWSAAHLA